MGFIFLEIIFLYTKNTQDVLYVIINFPNVKIQKFICQHVNFCFNTFLTSGNFYPSGMLKFHAGLKLMSDLC